MSPHNNGVLWCIYQKWLADVSSGIREDPKHEVPNLDATYSFTFHYAALLDNWDKHVDIDYPNTNVRVSKVVSDAGLAKMRPDRIYTKKHYAPVIPISVTGKNKCKQGPSTMIYVVVGLGGRVAIDGILSQNQHA